MDGIFEALLRQGGFAVALGVSLWFANKQAERHVQDVKDSAERERAARTELRELHGTTLNYITNLSTAMIELKASVDAVLDGRERLEETWSGRRRQAGAAGVTHHPRGGGDPK